MLLTMRTTAILCAVLLNCRAGRGSHEGGLRRQQQQAEKDAKRALHGFNYRMSSRAVKGSFPGLGLGLDFIEFIDVFGGVFVKDLPDFVAAARGFTHFVGIM